MNSKSPSFNAGPAVHRSQAERAPADWDRSGLPAWAYISEDLLEIEKDLLFRRHWQLAGHISDVPDPGDYFCFDVAGERAIIVRDTAGEIGVFHNVCRHRGSRVVAKERGSCGSALVCPFHGWSYNLDGTFRTAPAPRSLPPLDPAAHGLLPVEFEIWHGFVFVRFLAGPQPSVAVIMQRHEAEIASYRVQEAVPCGPFWSEEIGANWKCVRDVDNEGYHVAMAHPGLQDLYGKGYFDENWKDGTSRSFAPFDEGDGRLWSVRNYKRILPEIGHLSESHRKAWLYIGLFPNAVMFFYPDCIGFYQEFPVTSKTTVLRGATYALPDSAFDHSSDNRHHRRLRAARYLSQRIDANTAAEDIQLTIWSNEAFHSSGYQGFILSDLEYGVRAYHDQLRALMPVLNEDDAPNWGE